MLIVGGVAFGVLAMQLSHFSQDILDSMMMCIISLILSDTHKWNVKMCTVRYIQNQPGQRPYGMDNDFESVGGTNPSSNNKLSDRQALQQEFNNPTT
jgi:hypothetical protein